MPGIHHMELITVMGAIEIYVHTLQKKKTNIEDKQVHMQNIYSNSVQFALN